MTTPTDQRRFLFQLGPVQEWIGQARTTRDVPAATAILDRFLHHAEIIRITGRSCRLKDRQSGASSNDLVSKPAISNAGKIGGQIPKIIVNHNTRTGWF